jgi:hypothetical protein
MRLSLLAYVPSLIPTLLSPALKPLGVFTKIYEFLSKLWLNPSFPMLLKPFMKVAQTMF